VAQGNLTAAGTGEEVVPASDYRALQNQVHELKHVFGMVLGGVERSMTTNRSNGMPKSPLRRNLRNVMNA